MPQAAAYWVAAYASAAFSASAAAAAVAYAVAFAVTYAVVAVGISYALSEVSKSLMGRPKGMTSSGYRDIVIKSSIAPRSIIYGECTVGGVLVFCGTTGLTNEYLDFVIAVAGHEVDSIGDVWFDDEMIPNAEINGGNPAGGAVGGLNSFKPRDGIVMAYIYKYCGTNSQTASPLLSATDGTGYAEWTADHRLRGIAYVHIRLRRNGKTYAGGAPSMFRFSVKGAKLYDPRLDSTNGGSGSHRLNDATTWAWSRNSALVAADYIAGGTITNGVTTPVRLRGFGVSDPANSIDWASVIATANICDEQVCTNVGDPSNYQNRFECDGQLTPCDDFPDSDCIDQILTSMVGQVTVVNGIYRLHAGAYATPVYTLTESDLAGELQYVTGHGRSERYNTVRCTRFDGTLGHATEITPKSSTSYVTDDGRTLYRDIELPMTIDDYRAQRIAQLILHRSREQETIVWPGQFSAAKIGLWDTCYVTVAELGISAKVYRCIKRVVRPGGEGEEPLVELTLREEFSTTYTDPDPYHDYTSNTVPSQEPLEVGIDPPAGLTIYGVRGGLQFVIAPDDNALDTDTYEIYEHTAATPWSASDLIWEGRATTVVIPKDDVVVRYYWIRARRGAAVSTTYPAVTGYDAAAGVQDRVGYPPIIDPFFELATDQTYWQWNQDGFLLPSWATVDISATGGVVGGKMIISASSGDNNAIQIRPKRDPRYPVVTGDQYMLTVRLRRTSSIAGYSGLPATFAFNEITTNSDDTRTWPCAGDGILIDDLGALTLDEWTEFTGYITVQNHPKSEIQSPYGRFVFYVEKMIDGTIELDCVNATLVPQTFGATVNAGIVAKPASPSGLFLKDDGTWATPSGGGGGGGGISGPGTTTDAAVVTWDGTDGTSLNDNPTVLIDANGDLLVRSVTIGVGPYSAENTAVGNGALASASGGTYNIAIGYNALPSMTSASTNTVVGSNAAPAITTGGGNTIIGSTAAEYMTTGNSNVVIGAGAGGIAESGEKNIFIGPGTQPSSASGYYQTVIGRDITGKGDQTTLIGGYFGVYNEANSAYWSTTSDARVKRNIVDSEKGLSELRRVRVRNFQYLDGSGYDPTPVRTGVVAQELQHVFPEAVITEHEFMAVNADPIMWALVNAIKTLADDVDDLKAKAM